MLDQGQVFYSNRSKNCSISGIAILISVLIFLCAFFVLERVASSTNWLYMYSLLSVLFLVCYLFFLYKRSPVHFFLSFYPLYYFFSLFLSTLLINFGVPMIEIEEVGRANGGIWVTLIFMLITVEVSYFLFKVVSRFRIERLFRKMPVWFDRFFAVFLVFLALSVSFFVFLKYSSPLFLDVDRSAFFREVVHGSLSWVPTVVIQFSFFLFFYFATCKNIQTRVFAYILVFLYLLSTVFVLGQKFSVFILYLTFSFSLYACISNNPVINKRLIFLFLIFSLLLTVLVIVSYMFISDYGAAFIAIRIALQGQLLWAVLNEASFNFVWPDLYECYLGCAPYDGGSDFISAYFLPSDTYQFYKDGGTTLSGFMPALGILTLGFPGTIAVTILFAAVIGFLQACFFRLVRSKNLIPSFLLMKMLLGVFILFLAAIHTAFLGIIVSLLMLVAFAIVTNSNMPSRVRG